MSRWRLRDIWSSTLILSISWPGPLSPSSSTFTVPTWPVMYAVAAIVWTWALATLRASFAGPRDAARVFSSAIVFCRLMFILLYDSVMSSSLFDKASICFVSSLVDGAAWAAVAVVPEIATVSTATTRARSLVRAADNGMWPLFRRPPTGLADGFGREEGPTACADSPQVLGGSPARCGGPRRHLGMVTSRPPR